jgi:hypothetical protein
MLPERVSTVALIVEYHFDCDGWPGSDLDSHEDAECVTGAESQADAIKTLRARGWTVARYAGGWRARCPRHNERSARAERARSLAQLKADIEARDERHDADRDAEKRVPCECGHVGAYHRRLLTGRLECLVNAAVEWAEARGESDLPPGCKCLVFRPAAYQPRNATGGPVQSSQEPLSHS